MPLLLPSTDPQPLATGLYATDAFHRRPLFAVNGQVVRSWNEAHALHGPARLQDVNPSYVAALISGKKNAEAAPYTKIRRLPRAHHVQVISNGDVHSHAYDPLAGGATAMEAEPLHQFLRQGLIDHVQQALQDHAGSIGCEHSSGLDSNAVLGAIVHGVGVNPERIHTWSNEASGEGPLLKKFRSFHHLNLTQCHRLDADDAGIKSKLDHIQQQLEVFGAPAQIGNNSQVQAQMRQQGCTLLFSGFGGDQAVSHNAANVPTDLVEQGRWEELANWVGSKRELVKHTLGRSLILKHRRLAEMIVIRRSTNFRASKLLTRNLTSEGQQWLGPYINNAYPWEIDGFLHQHESIRKRSMADWVAIRAEDETRFAAYHGIYKDFPLLDEKLIGTLLHQDPILFGEKAGCGRLIHRKAFAPFLPPFLRENPIKDREPEEGFEKQQSRMLKEQKRLLEQIALSNTSSLHPALSIYWDLEMIRRATDEVLSSTNPALMTIARTSHSIFLLLTISAWFQSLDH